MQSVPGAGEDNVAQPLHPLVNIKSNPKKQSFASLSSLQPSGSAKSLIKSLTKSLTMKGKDSKDDVSGTAIRRNSEWDLEKNDVKRMSSFTIADSVEELHSSSTIPASNIATTQQQQRILQEGAERQLVGNHHTPATKWYMKIKPTEMHSSGLGDIKPKVLPQELIRRHKRIAFLGIMHDNLSKGFVKILENDPSHRWEQIYIFFPSDGCLRNHLSQNYRDHPIETLIKKKLECRRTLRKLLLPVVEDLRFLQYDDLMHCGSYWDWKDPGGFIHISPLTWGANPKTCPAMNYYWNSKVPSPEYRVYREGLEYLLGTAKPFEDGIGEGSYE